MDKKELRNNFLKTFWLLALGSLSYAILYGFNVLLATYLSASLYGDVTLALRTLLILSLVTLFGTSGASLRFLSRYLKNQQISYAKAFVRWNIRILVYSFSVCLGVALFSWFIVMILYYFDIFRFAHFHLSAYMLWVTPFSALSILLVCYIACDKKVVTANLCSGIVKSLLFLGFFAASLVYLKLDIIPANFVLLLLLAFCLLIAFELWVLWFKFPMIWKVEAEIFSLKLENDLQQEWLKFSIRLVFATLIFQIICILDLAFVELFTKNERDVGYYSAILTIAGIMWVIPQNLYQFFNLHISYFMQAESNIRIMQRQLNKLNWVLLITGTILMITLLFFSKQILLHFGPGYLVGQNTLYIVILANYIGLFSQPPINLLTYAGYESLVLCSNICEVMILLISGVVLTIKFGILGAASAYGIAISVKTGLVLYFARKNLPVKSLGLF